MTDHHQQEYRIATSDIKEFSELIDILEQTGRTADNADFNVMRAWRVIEETIRSNGVPAPSPSTPNKMNFNGGKCTCDEFFNCHDCRDLLRCNKEHDAEVRDKVLGDLIIHFKGFENQRTFQYSAADIIQYLEIFQRMKSLHTDKEKP